MARLIAVANCFTRQQLALLDPPHEIPGAGIGLSDLAYMAIEEDALGLLGSLPKVTVVLQAARATVPHGARCKGNVDAFSRMQRKAALWISGAFSTFPSGIRKNEKCYYLLIPPK